MKTMKKLLITLAIVSVIFTLFAIAVSASDSYDVLDGDGNVRATITYDPSTQNLHFGKNQAITAWWDFDIAKADSFLANYKVTAKSATFDLFSTIRVNQGSVLSGFTALEKVIFAEGQVFHDNSWHSDTWWGQNKGLFVNCSALTTVYFGNEADAKDGVADFSGMNVNFRGMNGKVEPYLFTYNLFSGCSAIEEVIFPELSGGKIWADTFANCTSLKSVTIPASFTTIEDGAFATTAIVNINAPEGSVAYNFAVNNGISVNTPSAPSVDSYDVLDGDGNVRATITYDPSTQNLHFGKNQAITTWWDFDIAKADSFLANYKVTAKSATFDLFSTIRVNQGSVLSGFTALEKVIFAEGQVFHDNTWHSDTWWGSNKGLFVNCSALTTVYFGNEADAKDGVADFSGMNVNFRGMNGKVEPYLFTYNLFSGCSAIEEVIFPELSGGKIWENTFANCTSLKSVTIPASFTTIEDGAFDTTALEKINAPIGSYAYNFALANGYANTIDSYEIYDGDGNLRATITYNHITGNLDFDRNEEFSKWWDFDINTNVYAFISKYKDLAVSATFEKFSNIRIGDRIPFFKDFTKLEKVIFSAEQSFQVTSWVSDPDAYVHDSVGLFNGCTALTTVYFGDESDAKVGVADLSGMVISSNIYPLNIPARLFRNCTSLTTVILPENALFTTVYASTFENCTSLKSVTIPAQITTIKDGAFNSCTALKVVYLEAPASVIGAGTFSSAMSGVTVYCASISAADAVNTTLTAASIPASSVRATISRGGMTIPGYSIKETGYNGLRSHFAFDETVFDGTGYTLVEYGTLSSTKTNWSNFSETFGLENSVITLNGGEFVTPEKIVKTAIYNKTSGYENNSDHNDNSNVKFTVTIIKFQNEEQYKSEIVSCGYEIWEKNGEYFVLYTREEVMGYDTVSLYKLTLGMLSDGAVKISVDDNSPVWTVINGCEKTPIALENPDITAFLIADPVNEGKYIAVYATATSATLDTYGLTAEELKNVSAIVIGENVVRIESEWKAYIDEKLASLPEGKSFIVYTDTHMELDNERNTKKAASLIEYVRSETGIKTVVNLGDPYTGEATLEKADKVFKTAVGDYFYDVFGKDGLYVVGNHDANYTTWNSDANGTKGYKVTNEAESGKYAYDYLLPDSVIYNETVKNIADKNGIHFNDAMLSLVDSLDYDWFASNIGDYTEDDLKEEFKAWAKLHYYYDDEVNNIRYIVLNTGNCGLIEYYLLDSRWTMILSTQLDFFVDALKSTPVGYDIAVLGHQMGYEDGDNTSNVHNDVINKIIAAFKKGEKMEWVQMWYNKETNPNMHVLSRTPDNRNYDFTGISFEGTIFTVSGHWHDERGYVWETKDGSFAAHIYTGEAVADDAVFYIGISNDCLEGTSDDGINHEKGTLTENSFSILTIKEDGNIVVTGFGAATPVRNFNYN